MVVNLGFYYSAFKVVRGVVRMLTNDFWVGMFNPSTLPGHCTRGILKLWNVGKSRAVGSSCLQGRYREG